MQLQSSFAHPYLQINTNAAAVFVIIFNVYHIVSVTTEKLISSMVPVVPTAVQISGTHEVTQSNDFVVFSYLLEQVFLVFVLCWILGAS
jgi:hypothetical protein